MQQALEEEKAKVKAAEQEAAELRVKFDDWSVDSWGDPLPDRPAVIMTRLQVAERELEELKKARADGV